MSVALLEAILCWTGYAGVLKFQTAKKIKTVLKVSNVWVLGQLPLGQLPWGQLPRGQLPHRTITPVGQLPLCQLPPGQIPLGTSTPRTIIPRG